MDFAHPIAASRVRADASLRLAGVLFFGLAALFLTVIMLGASIAPGYDIRAGAISDLGAIPETALLFNATLVLVGAANIAGGSLYWLVHRRAWILGVFVAAGIGAIGAGLFPLDSGGPHGLFALVAFLCFNLEALAVTTIVRGPMRALAALAGLTGLVFLVLMALGDAGVDAAFGPIGHGATERMIAYPVMAWLLALGGYLMAPAERARRP